MFKYFYYIPLTEKVQEYQKAKFNFKSSYKKLI